MIKRIALLPLALLAVPALAQTASQFPDRPIARAEVTAVVKRQFAATFLEDKVLLEAQWQRFREIPQRPLVSINADDGTRTVSGGASVRRCRRKETKR